jgi:hypothetical protein
MASDADTIRDAIVELADKPAAVSMDAGSLTNRPLTELIEVEKHIAAQNGAADNEFFGIRARRARFGHRTGGSSE